MRLRDRSFHDADPQLLGLVGLAVVGGIVVLALAYATLGWFQPTYVVSGSFTDAAGLRSGSAVTVAGVEVGRVTGVTGDFDHGHVTVTWEVEAGVDLGPRTRADIEPSSLFGGYAIRLSGPVEAPYLADLPAEERHRDLDRTSVPIGLTAALDTATSLVDDLDTDLVETVMSRTVALVAETERDLVPLLEGFADVATLVEGGSADLERLAAEGRRLAEVARASEDDLDALVAAATALLDELGTREAQLRALLGDGHATVRRLGDLLAEQRADLERLTAGVSEVVAVVGARADEVNHGLALLGPAFEELAAAGDSDNEWLEFTAPSFGPITRGSDAITDPLSPLTELDLPALLDVVGDLVGLR